MDASIEMLPADGISVTSEQKVLRRKERLKIEKMAEESKERGKAIYGKNFADIK